MSTKKSKAQRLLEKHHGPFTIRSIMESYRLCAEISQADFAKMLGVSRSYICDIEHERKRVSPEKALEFARILKEPEKVWLQAAIQDILDSQGLDFGIELVSHRHSARV